MSQKPIASTAAHRARLIAARYQRGWSQQQMADLLETTPLNVSRWERGLTTPSPYFRHRLTQLFQASEHELDLLPEPSLAPNPPVIPAPSALSPPAACYDPAIPLPILSAPLVGRAPALAALKAQLLETRTVALAALGGLPGVGKTTLAAVLAADEEVRAHFHDGILWAGLGPSAQILDILSRWGTLLGVTTEETTAPPSSLEDWRRRLQTAIGERRFLLILDDGWRIEDVLVCQVGGPHCGYLLTTRLPQLAAQFMLQPTLVVRELDNEASLLLLRSLAPDAVEQEPGRVRTLIQAVGGLPLALTLMGNYLRIQSYSGQPRRIRAALTRLHDAQTRLALSEARPGQEISLQAILAVSEQQLSPRARAAFRALAVLPSRPDSFAEEAALAVCAESVEVLDELGDAGLLESVGPGRYTLHQTLIDYARALLSESAPRERLVRYGVSYATRHRDGFATLERESATLEAALASAHELRDQDALVRGVLALGAFWKARSLYKLAEMYLPLALEAAVNSNQVGEQVQLLLLQGEITLYRGAYEPSQQSYEQAIQLARQEGAIEQICAGLYGLSWLLLLRKIGNIQQPGDLVQEALALAQSHGLLRDQARLSGLLGVILEIQGDREQAIVCIQEGLALVQQVGDHGLRCVLLNSLASVSYNAGKIVQGEQYFQEGLQLARQMGYRQWECLLLSNLGVIVLAQGDYQQAEQLGQETLHLAQQIGSPERKCLALFILGDLAAARGNYKQAVEYAQEGLHQARQIGLPEQVGRALWSLGVIAVERGDFLLAEQYGLEELHLSRNIDHSGLICNSLDLLGEIAEAQGNRQQAERYWRELLELARPLGDPSSICSGLTGLAVITRKQGQIEQAKAFLQEGLDLIRPLKQPRQLCKMLLEWGELHLQQQEWEYASRAFEEMQSGAPTEARKEQALARFGLARVAAARGGNFAEARQLGETSLGLLVEIEHREAAPVRHWLAMLLQNLPASLSGR